MNNISMLAVAYLLKNNADYNYLYNELQQFCLQSGQVHGLGSAFLIDSYAPEQLAKNEVSMTPWNTSNEFMANFLLLKLFMILCIYKVFWKDAALIRVNTGRTNDISSEENDLFYSGMELTNLTIDNELTIPKVNIVWMDPYNLIQNNSEILQKPTVQLLKDPAITFECDGVNIYLKLSELTKANVKRKLNKISGD